MKFLKWVVIAILVLIVVVLVVALFLPSEYHVERSAVINAPIEEVYAQVADFHNWEHWMPWRELEPTAEYTVSNPGTGVGAKMTWVGDTVGTGSITVVEVAPPKLIQSKLVFGEEEAISDQIWTFESAPEGTRVSWAIEGEAGYPFGRFMGIMFDGLVGADFDRGLSKLKAYVEGLPDPPTTVEDAKNIEPDVVAEEPVPIDVR